MLPCSVHCIARYKAPVLFFVGDELPGEELDMDQDEEEPSRAD